MQSRKVKKSRFDNKRKTEGIEEFATSIGGEMAVYENPISYPVTNGEVGYDFHGGLIESKTSRLIEEAILLRHNKPAQLMSEWNSSLEKTKLPKIESTFLFGGILFNNFGHFLLESIGRLWAYNVLRRFDPYILFYAPWGIPNYKEKNNYVHQFFKGFDIPLKRLVFFTEIVQLKRIIIPEQKYGFGKCRTPDSTFLNFIKSFNAPDHLPRVDRNADKVYVSRSQLPFSQGRPLGETYFEKYLQANGYMIVYPEKHTLFEQLTIYKRAKKIIFCDGGAIYCSVLLPDLNAEIAIVARRRDHRFNYKELTEHFYGYKKAVLWIDEILGQYQYGLETWDALGEIDWYKVSLTLKKEKFVESTFEGLDTSTYSDIKRKELQQYIQSIQTNPLFLNYMQKLNEQFPLLPSSF